MNILKRFNRFYQPSTGLVEDPRLQAEKDQDYQAEEVLKAAAVAWREKPQSEWRKFPIFNQDGSGSCVAQTCAKALGVENFLEEGKFVHYSARDIYTRRANNSEGMWLQDALDICSKRGATLEQLMPSQGLNEAQMNNATDRKTIDEQVALVGKASNYVQSGNIDFDLIANALAQGKGVALACRFNAGDWNNPEVVSRANGQYGHLVMAVDYTPWKGEKALIFDNSWDYPWGLNGQGILRESQKVGVLGWGYLLELKNTWRDTQTERPKPNYFFQKDLMLKMDNFDVGMLQECLQYEEMFPTNYPTTMYYGGITAKAVRLFVAKYLPDQIANYDGKKIDLTLRAKLNQLFQ